MSDSWKNELRALDTQGELLVEIFSSSPDGLVLASLDGQLLVASPRALQMWGYASNDEIAGRSMFEFLNEQGRKNATIVIERLLEGRPSGAIIYEMLRKDLSLFYCSGNGSILHDNEGDPFAIFIILREIKVSELPCV